MHEFITIKVFQTVSLPCLKVQMCNLSTLFNATRNGEGFSSEKIKILQVFIK